MKRIALLPATILAASLSVGACSSERAVAPEVETTAPSLARSGPQTVFGNLIAALNNIAVNIDELNALNDLTIGDITLIDVDNVLNGNNVEALNNALNRNQVDIGILQNFLNNITLRDCAVVSCNDLELLRDFLRDSNIAITDVIAIDVLSGGDVIVFTR